MNNGPRALDISALITLITALIYAAGWSYAYHWYDRFELGLIGLGIPAQYHFMYGFWVLESFWWLVLFVAVLLAAALVFWGRVAPFLVPAAPVWAPLTFVLVYLLGGAVAGADYADHRKSGFQRYPWVRIWTEPGNAKDPAKLQQVQRDLADGKYRLLLQTSGNLYLIKPRDSGEIPTLQVPKDKVRALRRIPTNPGNP